MKRNKKIVFYTAAVFLLSALSSLLYSKIVLFQKIVSIYKCPFKKLTGYPCATCGFTRCVLLTGSGKFKEAFFVSPLAFILFLYLFAIFAVNLYFVVKGSNRSLLWPWKTRPQTGAILLIVLLFISWIYKLSAAIFFC